MQTEPARPSCNSKSLGARGNMVPLVTAQATLSAVMDHGLPAMMTSVWSATVRLL